MFKGESATFMTKGDRRPRETGRQLYNDRQVCFTTARLPPSHLSAEELCVLPLKYLSDAFPENAQWLIFHKDKHIPSVKHTGGTSSHC